MSAFQSLTVVLQFAFATVLPTILSVTLVVLNRFERFKNLKYWKKQVLIGILFGAIAVYGTEFGIRTLDVSMNVRDAAPMVAGLYFGGPAGIIAGIIGGVERWFAALWGRGMYTRLACSLATTAVGFFAALLKKYIFEDRLPSWPLALVMGMVAEVLHLLLVFVTNLNTASTAFRVVQACASPMIICNGLGVALAGLGIAIASHHDLIKKGEPQDISQKIQRGMILVVAVGFVITVGFTFLLEENITYEETTDTLARELNETECDIKDIMEQNLLEFVAIAAEKIPTISGASNEALKDLAKELGLSEIHVIDGAGNIAYSTDESNIGFDMSSGAQSKAFLFLLRSGRDSFYVQDYQPTSIDETVWRKYAGAGIEGGFIQVGYDPETSLDYVREHVRETVANSHVGRDGFVLVFLENGEFLGTRSDLRVSDKEANAIFESASKQDVGNAYTFSWNSKSYRAMACDVEGFTSIALMPMSEVIESRDVAVLVISFMEVLVLAMLFLALFVLVRHVVVRSIWQVNSTLNEITSGNLKAEVNVRDSVEFASLSDDINRTVAALREAIAAESARIERDLATAKAIQESALPRTFPPFPDVDAFDIYASMNAAREVGGDFYDFFMVDGHTLGFLIADVSGKGIPASLFMMAAKSELANYVKSGMELSEAVRRANLNLCNGNNTSMFVTAWVATLDYETGNLTFVNAGHNPPLLRHEGSWKWLKERSGLFLGSFEMARFKSYSVSLVKGDELLLYTDGVNEAFSASEEEYGNDRLEAFLSTHTDLGPRSLVNALKADLRRWTVGAEQSDDITMLCLEFGRPPERLGSITVRADSLGLDKLRNHMGYELRMLGCPPAERHAIELTIEEHFTNVCEHGYANADEPGDVKLEYCFDSHGNSVVISISDWGIQFNPLTYDGPTANEGDSVTGAGIILAKHGVDDFSYVYDNGCNTVAFSKSW